jgi:RimJ/RimL family protein N-acetyltransferase
MIKGKKVGLRCVEKEDLPILKEWRNNPIFRKNFRESRELNNTNQDKWFETINQTNSINYMFSIIDLENHSIIGACGLLYINWIIRSADISFYIGHNNLYIDKSGYAKEAATLLFNYGYNNLNLNKTWMELYEFDKLKLDFFQHIFKFKIDGTLRENCYENGQYWNSHLLSLLKKEYKIIL